MVAYSICFMMALFAQPSDPTVSFVPADSYAIRRFAEVIDDHVQGTVISPREKLIQLRARLFLTEEKKGELEHTSNPDFERPLGLTKEARRKSLDALQDHLKKEIKKIERQITQKSGRSAR